MTWKIQFGILFMNRDIFGYFKYSWKDAFRKWDAKYSASWVEIPILDSFNILVGILLGPTDLFKFKEDVIFCTSDSLVGARKKEFWFLSFRKSGKCLFE